MSDWQVLKKASPDEVIQWAEAQSWASDMAQCQQDVRWHAEGDVWTHTKMVCAELFKLEQWPDLQRREQNILLFTALFHDAGKPATSQVDPVTNQISSPKHAIKGEHLARRILRELECDFETRETIARLVRFHGRPAFLHEKPKPEIEVISLSLLVNHKLLHLFTLADTRGRATDSYSRPEENLHYWKLVAQEQGCYETPYKFANDHARFLFYRSDDRDLHYLPHEDYRCSVTMMCGLPGSGKDSWLAANRPEQPVVSLDEIRRSLKIAPTDDQGRVSQSAKESCRELFREVQSFSFSATNLMRATRKRWIDLFADYGARVEIIYVEPHLKTILKQNKERKFVVPEDVILRFASKCEPPTLTEAHAVHFEVET